MDNSIGQEILRHLDEHSKSFDRHKESSAKAIHEVRQECSDQGKMIARIDERTQAFVTSLQDSKKDLNDRMGRMERRSMGLSTLAGMVVSGLVIGWKMLWENPRG